MNPCPCGHLGDPKAICRCTRERIERYRSRISGPLLDRIDLHIDVPRLPAEALQGPPSHEATAEVATRVRVARERQEERQGCTNARLAGAGARRSLRARRRLRGADAARDAATVAVGPWLPSRAACRTHDRGPCGSHPRSRGDTSPKRSACGNSIDMTAATVNKFDADRLIFALAHCRWSHYCRDFDPALDLTAIARLSRGDGIAEVGVSMTAVKPASCGPQPGKVGHEQGRRDALGRVAIPEGRNLAGVRVDAGPARVR